MTKCNTYNCTNEATILVEEPYYNNRTDAEYCETCATVILGDSGPMGIPREQPTP